VLTLRKQIAQKKQEKPQAVKAEQKPKQEKPEQKQHAVKAEQKPQAEKKQEKRPAEQAAAPEAKKPKAESAEKPAEKKVTKLPNGMILEDVEVGKGPVAKPGKRVRPLPSPIILTPGVDALCGQVDEWQAIRCKHQGKAILIQARCR
jgi:FKBP-type peptidyl-prolyl cis-trans isomerase